MDAAASRSLQEGQRRARAPDPAARRPAGGPPLLALQRAAGNAAVTALLAARIRPGAAERTADLDAGLQEAARSEPDLPRLEKGLRAAAAVGVPVDMDGAAQKPPASALAAPLTGFGAASVAAKKPVPPPKPVPTSSPLAKAARRAPGPVGGRRTGGPEPAAPTRPATAPTATGAVDHLAPPAPPTRTAPTADPAFAAVVGAVARNAQAEKAHPPAAAEAKAAQDAAVPPSDDVDSQAKAAKVDSMDAQPAGTFDKKAFIAAVTAAIEAKSPKTLEEADDYQASGRAGDVKADVKGLVAGDKQRSAEAIETATDAAPDAGKAVPKPVDPMVPDDPGRPSAVPAAGAVPKPASPDQLNLAAGPHQAGEELAGADVSEEQLATSNEPEFTGALAAKQEAAQHAATAPAEFRQQEAVVLAQSRAEAEGSAAAAVAGMHGSRTAALTEVMGAKSATKGKDEARRAQVSAKVQSIFATTEGAVKQILAGIDPKVEQEFEAGEKKARAEFESFVAAKMSAYKKDRYGGWLGGYRWLRDKIRGMPPAVNEFFAAGREVYLTGMNRVITRVADVVGTDLAAAKARIAAGKAEIATYVASLPADLKKVGAQAAQDVGDQFEQLETEVTEKQDALVDTLASKYVESRSGLDDRIEEMQAENKGLVDKAIGAIKAVVNTIRELAAMLRTVLSRVAGVVGDIVKSPVSFLSNLIAGVKGGILKFRDTIGDHLKKGLTGWLFGSLAQGGVEVPDTFDAKGIVKLLASVFGLTWANIRSRLVRQIGAKAMAAAEKGVEIFQVLAGQGVAGLWQMLMEKLGDIKEMILEKVRDFVITKVITAGITWLIGLLNPAAAFIKACKLIYDVVMFFVDNAARIGAFVNTVIDSVADVVRGNVSGVVEKINNVLGQMVPILIGFFASVIGLGGIGQKIRAIVETLQKPVTKALDFVISTGLKLAAPIIRGLKGVSGKVKAKVAAGEAHVTGKLHAGRAHGKGEVDSKRASSAGRDPTGPKAAVDSRTMEQKKAAVDGALRASELIMDRPDGTQEKVAAALPGLKEKFALQVLTIVNPRPGTFRVHAELNPRGDSRVKGATPTWQLAPGGFRAHEGRQFINADGVPMVNRRGQPILVHTIARHVDLARGGVAGRVVGGLDFATGFLSAAIMERAVLDCLSDRATELNQKLCREGERVGNGESAMVSRTLPYKCGYGYSLEIRPSQVNKSERHRQRDAVEVAESSLASVTVIVRVSDSARGLFMVETAFPTPRGG